MIYLHNQVKVRLSEVKNNAITFDMWTSVSNLGIGAITAQLLFPRRSLRPTHDLSWLDHKALVSVSDLARLEAKTPRGMSL